MWEIKLVDIGGDGLVTTKKTAVDSLPEAEVVAAMLCGQHLGTLGVELIHTQDLIYGVMVEGREVGVAVIRTL